MAFDISFVALARHFGVTVAFLKELFERLKRSGHVRIDRRQPRFDDVQTLRDSMPPKPRPRRVSLNVLQPGATQKPPKKPAKRPRLRIAGDFPTPPTTRAGCVALPRPCPALNCRHNLFWEQANGIAERGTFEDAIAFIRQERGACVLDLAEKGGRQDFAVAEVMGMRRQRVNQIEFKALKRIAKPVAEVHS